AFDTASLGGESGHAPSVALHACNSGVLDDSHAKLAGAGCEGVGQLARIGVAVRRHPDRAAYSAHVERTEALQCLASRDELRVEAEAPRGGDEALEFVPAVVARCQPDAADLLPAGCVAGLALEGLVGGDAGAHQRGQTARAAQLAD